MNKIILIDGNSLINRAFYATPLLTNSDGVFTNAVYGFLNMLIKIIEDNKPTHMLVAFDRKAPTFRHKMYDNYKAGRKGMPDELFVQMPVLKEVLQALNIAMYEEDGIEADDIIGTFAKKFNIDTIIFTGDRDELQLVDDTTSVFLTKTGISNLQKITLQNFEEEYGFLPNQVIEYKALCGDASDNIPGVKKVGDKTAKTLLKDFGYLENLYENIDKISGKLHDNLVEDKEIAFLSRELATIKCDCPIDMSLEQLALQYPFVDSAKEVFKKYQFSKLLQNVKIFQNSGVVETQIEEPAKLEYERVEVCSLSQLQQVLEKNKNCKTFACDFDDKITFAFDSKCQYLLTCQVLSFFDMQSQSANFGEKDFALTCQQIFEDASTKKLLFDSKNTRHILAKYGIALENCQDLMLKNYIAQSAVKQTCSQMLQSLNFDEDAKSVAFFDVDKILQQKLERQNQIVLFEQVELPLAKVLFDMEEYGFALDKDFLQNLNAQFTQQLKDLTSQIYSLAGEEFNINSTKQLSHILFEKLNLVGGRKTKSGYSTDIDVLSMLEGFHPIVEKLIQYRTLSKLNSTYVEGLLSQMDKNNKVHTVFNQALTQTGRLSSKEPNLQNIPIREEIGRQLRNAFVPSLDYLVSADYSQIELRLLAHFSQDENLIEAYNSEKDIHSITASQIFGKKLEEVTPSMRRSAKAVNFGIIYGISDYGLAKQIDVPVKVAKEYIQNYFLAYPKVKQYMEDCKQFAKTYGYATTLLNRRRIMSDIHSPNYNIRSFAERASMNMPLQGTSADIIKIAMNNVAKALQGKKSKLVLQVHDELIVDTAKEELEFVRQTLIDCMQNATTLTIPLKVSLK